MAKQMLYKSTNMRMHKYKLKWDLKDFSKFFPNPVTAQIYNSTEKIHMEKDSTGTGTKDNEEQMAVCTAGTDPKSEHGAFGGFFSGEPQPYLHPHCLTSKFDFSNRDRKDFMDVLLNLSVVERPDEPGNYNFKLGFNVSWQETRRHVSRDIHIELDMLDWHGRSWFNGKSHHTCDEANGIHNHRKSFICPESLGGMWQRAKDRFPGDKLRIGVTVALLDKVCDKDEDESDPLGCGCTIA